MDNQPAFDRELIVPIILGGFSVIGIIIALFIGRALSSPAQAPLTPSPTPFEFVFLGTEPAIATPLVEGSEIATLPEDPFDAGPTPTLDAPGPPSALTPGILPQPNRTITTTALVLRTSTPGGGPPSNGGPGTSSGPPISSTAPSTATVGTPSAFDTYDDTHPDLLYVGTWMSQTNVSGAYQNTLHISTGPLGNLVTLDFFGQEIRFFYQAGPSLGRLAITVDDDVLPPLDLAASETQIKEWVYALESVGDHTIAVEHVAGGAVNIDSFVVPRVTLTPTPTATPTRTLTPTQ